MKNFFELTRSYSIPMSITPFLIGAFCAYNIYSCFSLKSEFLVNFILVLLAVSMLHLGVNLLDDYIDVKNKLKSGLKLNEISFKNYRKARLIIDNVYSLDSIKGILFILFLVPFLIGVFFSFNSSLEIALIMILCALLFLSYPNSSKYGLQEFIVALIFGPILINGTYYAMVGEFNSCVFLFSISSGIATSILLLAHNLMDYEYDVAAKKMTIPVILKNKNLTINFISILILVSYSILSFAIQRYDLSRIFYLPIVLSIPCAIKLVLSLYDYINLKSVEFQKKWYYGPMCGLEDYPSMKYFMYRFYLARNFASIFNLFLAIACLCSFASGHICRYSYGFSLFY